MVLHKLFSYNVEVQYKSYFLSKAMFFTVITTLLNIILPFVLAYRSRGFWLRSHYFYEQPSVHFTYEYLLVAETDDPSEVIVCGEADFTHGRNTNEEYCAEIEVKEYDNTGDGKNDDLEFKFHIIVPPNKTIASILLILGLDFQIKSTCPLRMQSLSVINKDFSAPPSGLDYYGDVTMYQTIHLPCMRNVLDTKYNTSAFEYVKRNNMDMVDFILGNYFRREVITKTKQIFLRSHYGHTGTLDIGIHLRVPETQVRYTPSLLQELKWAWPQYLSLFIIFYFILNRIKRFVFNNRLLMVWEIQPDKRQ